MTGESLIIFGPRHLAAGACALTIAIAACTDDITPPRSTASGDTPRFSASIIGNQITTAGNYTYYAASSGVNPSFSWFTRTCPGRTVSGCSVGWGFVGSGTYVDPNTTSYTKYLTPSPCTERPAGPTYQVRVDVHAWQQPAVADTFLTYLSKVCDP